jgi:hypothetical protein
LDSVEGLIIASMLSIEPPILRGVVATWRGSRATQVLAGSACFEKVGFR